MINTLYEEHLIKLIFLHGLPTQLSSYFNLTSLLLTLVNLSSLRHAAQTVALKLHWKKIYSKVSLSLLQMFDPLQCPIELILLWWKVFHVTLSKQ